MKAFLTSFPKFAAFEKAIQAKKTAIAKTRALKLAFPSEVAVFPKSAFITKLAAVPKLAVIAKLAFPSELAIISKLAVFPKSALLTKFAILSENAPRLKVPPIPKLAAVAMDFHFLKRNEFPFSQFLPIDFSDSLRLSGRKGLTLSFVKRSLSQAKSHFLR